MLTSLLNRKIPKRTIIANPSEIWEIIALIRKGMINSGPFVASFERLFREYVGAKEAVALSSGRFALYMILSRLGLKQGDKILLSAYNFRGVPQALIVDGFIPVYVDADPHSYQMDISRIEERIDKKTKAIIATHLFGHPCDMQRISEIAKKYGLFVIEDASHALGAFYRGSHVGTFSDAGFFSLTGSKPLTTSFGGMIVTNNASLAQKLRADLAGYGFPCLKDVLGERMKTHCYAILTHKYFYDLCAYPISLIVSAFGVDSLDIYNRCKKRELAQEKFRFTNAQACVGVRQFSFVIKSIAGRRTSAELFLRHLHPAITQQAIQDESRPSYFMCAFQAKDKRKLARRLLVNGIDINLNYAINCAAGSSDIYCGQAEKLGAMVFTIMLPFTLTGNQAVRLSQVLNENIELLA